MIITMTAWKRPRYTGITLASLVLAEKPEPVKLIACLEPGHPEVAREFEGLPFEVELHVNEQQLGGPQNTGQAVQLGFQQADRIIHLEDDTPIAEDALLYFKWALDKYESDAQVWTISGYNRAESVVEDAYNKAYRLRWFTPWAWATWQDRYIEASADWPGGRHGWDHYMNHKARKDRVEIRPILSRVQNIGAIDGYNCPSPQFHRMKHHTPTWAQGLGVFCRKFEEAPIGVQEVA